MRTAAKLGKSREILLCALLGLLVVGLLERYPSLAPFNRTWLEQNFPFSPWLLNLVAGGVVAWFVYSRRLLHALALWLVSRSTEPGFLYLPQPNSRRKRFLDHAPWVGREDEVNELKRFLDASEPFQWWWITGEGGIGKSRLALELLQIAKRRQFDAGFWLGDVQILDEWRPRRRTLIVLDDAGQVAPGSQLLRCIELIRKLIDQHQSRALPHPVRLLLIERDRPLELEGPGATERSDWEFCFRREPLHLQKLPSKAVEALISAVARQWKKDPPQGNARERVLRLGTDNPFWLLLALHSYFEHGKVD